MSTTATTAKMLPVGTRVTTMYAVSGYEAQETQAVVREVTDLHAVVEILGLTKRVTVNRPWGLVKKVEYRAFRIVETAETFTIHEVEPKNSHPMNWAGLGEYSREGAWKVAQTRGKRTYFMGRDGVAKDLGTPFSAEAYERAVYSGYVGYGQSMTDGYYAPESFESFIESFRRSQSFNQNDCGEAMKAALPLYQATLTLQAA